MPLTLKFGVSLSPESHLALIIALDQFPRNMYRATPAAFAWDRYALAAAKRMVERKTDILLSQRQRPFVYMPYMHSENLELSFLKEGGFSG